MYYVKTNSPILYIQWPTPFWIIYPFPFQLDFFLCVYLFMYSLALKRARFCFSQSYSYYIHSIIYKFFFSNLKYY